MIKVVPMVMRFDGLRVVVYPNDHRPAHVHVIGRGGEAVFNLNCPAGRWKSGRTMDSRVESSATYEAP